MSAPQLEVSHAGLEAAAKSVAEDFAIFTDRGVRITDVRIAANAVVAYLKASSRAAKAEAPRSGGTPAAALLTDAECDRIYGETSAAFTEWESANDTSSPGFERFVAATRALIRGIAGALSGVAPEPSAHKIASEVERLGAEVASLREASQRVIDECASGTSGHGAPSLGAIAKLRAVLAPASREPHK